GAVDGFGDRSSTVGESLAQPAGAAGSRIGGRGEAGLRLEHPVEVPGTHARLAGEFGEARWGLGRLDAAAGLRDHGGPLPGRRGACAAPAGLAPAVRRLGGGGSGGLHAVVSASFHDATVGRSARARPPDLAAWAEISRPAGTSG